MQRVISAIEERFPGEGLRRDYREELVRVCTAFFQSGLADSKFANEVASGSDSKFWSCVSEALVYDRIREMQFSPRAAIGVGPDFLLLDGTRRVWVEVICPEPVGVPVDWLKIKANHAGTVPHDEILLRWASAIYAKADKLVGAKNGKEKCYASTGIVQANDVYVIAVNGCQLRHGPFAALLGISQFPYAAEAVFPIGPYQVTIDRETQRVVNRGHQERFHIWKSNGAPIPAYMFLDPHYKMVSAIWAVDFNGGRSIRSSEPSALIHNPLALNPLRRGFLPSDAEYGATPLEEGEYSFTRLQE